MNVAVVGAGPIGQAVAAALIANEHTVTLVELNAAIREQIADTGIRLRGQIDLTVAAPEVAASIEALEGKAIDAVFVAVKATATELVGGALADALDANATVVSWQNGIDTERTLATTLAPERIVRAVINQGVSLDEHGAVHVAFDQPPHLLCEFVPAGKERAEAVVELLAESALRSQRSAPLAGAVWQKTALNAALNATCALTGMDIKGVWTDAYAGELARSVLRETLHVARANEIWLGSGFYRYALDYLDAAGAHKPSMLADRLAGRRTEIDYINGKIVEYGRMAGVATPYNETLLALVKTAERSSRFAGSAE